MIEKVAASVRYRNPGAMWDSSISRKWGSEKAIVLNDGQANHIAVFPSYVDGACAQFDLWRSRYTNMTLEQAVYKWSGGNSSEKYISYLCSRAGITPKTMITEGLLSGPTGIALLKAQATWEAGGPYPLQEYEWKQAQTDVFAHKNSATHKKSVVVAAGSATGAVVVHQAASQGASPGTVITIILGIVAAVVVGYYLIHRRII